MINEHSALTSSWKRFSAALWFWFQQTAKNTSQLEVIVPKSSYQMGMNMDKRYNWDISQTTQCLKKIRSAVVNQKKLCRCFFQLVDVIDDIVNDLSSLLMKRIEKKTVLQMFLQFVDVIDDIVDDFSSLLMKRKLCCRCFFPVCWCYWWYCECFFQFVDEKKTVL
jgi:hypothetical protein